MIVFKFGEIHQVPLPYHLLDFRALSIISGPGSHCPSVARLPCPFDTTGCEFHVILVRLHLRVR
jgi:hypothetical protein